MNVRSARRPFVLAALVLLGGCAALAPRLETPRLSIVGVEMVKADLWEQQLKVRMRVQNPNERALPVRGLSCRLELQGEEFAHGVSAAGFEVPALGEVEFDMNLTANMASALVRLLGRSGEQRAEPVDYRLVGKVSLASGLLRSIPFEETGSFKLR